MVGMAGQQMKPDKALAHAVAYCDRSLPKWLPWQVEALHTVLSLTMGWGTFRRRMAISLDVVAADIDRKIYGLAYPLIQDIQRAAADWIAQAAKPSAQARAEAWLRGALDRPCDHPREDVSLPMGDQRYCLRCGARVPT